ncbi:MAG: ABC transporter permease [Acidimicrobiales bacterium]
MASNLLRRAALLVLVLVATTFFTAMLTSFVRGDAVDALAPTGTPELKAQLRHELHLDVPVMQRYGSWLGDFLRGDLGKIYNGTTSTTEVSDSVSRTLPTSIKLMAGSQILALLIALPLGVITAYKAGSLFDKAMNSTAFALLAVPNFVIALLLIYFLGVRLQLYPVRWDKSLSGLDGTLQNYLLPTISLAAGQVAVYMRLLRSDMIATLQEDYITMAKAKGMSSSRILWRHAFRPSSLTLLTVAGLNVGTLIGGAVVIEFIFGVPGIGFEIQSAVASHQYAALQSYVAIIAVAYIGVNALIDVLYSVLDPRIRRA